MKVRKLGLILAAVALILVAALPGQAYAKEAESAEDKAFDAYQDYVRNYGWYWYYGSRDLTRQKFLEKYYGVSYNDFYSRYDAWNDFYNHLHRVGSPYRYDNWDYAHYLSKYYGGYDYYPAYWNWDYAYYWPNVYGWYNWYNGGYYPFYAGHNDGDLELDYVMHVNYYDDFINAREHTPAPMEQRAKALIVYGDKGGSIDYPLFVAEPDRQYVAIEDEDNNLDAVYKAYMDASENEEVKPVYTPYEADSMVEDYALQSLQQAEQAPAYYDYNVSESEQAVQSHFLNSLTY